jgi:hypothetical protein
MQFGVWGGGGCIFYVFSDWLMEQNLYLYSLVYGTLV